MQLSKTYVAEILLGAETDTLDNTGEITRRCEIPTVSQTALEVTQKQFSGEISQIPPIYSNLKIDGRRAHEIARSGGEAELKPRQVTISSLNLWPGAAGTLDMECTVSSGTYIRSLARDIAQALGTCGHLSSLRRTRIGDFSLPEHSTVPEVPGTIFREMNDFEALSFLGTVSLSTEAAARFFHGAFIRLADIEGTGMQRVTCEGKFIGLGMMEGDLLKPRKSYPN